ncbi:DUF2971 domain-containing protein [Chitinibacter sp. S2-10]|uniref:DUF2971 domain-containing protein n=1 Tax=Chitinibacter sp. S2-10 TaxID=3373597 RepID=UPI003977B19C
MILYKYVDLEAALLIIQNATVKFTKISDLNDPFEVSSLFYESLDREYGATENHFRKLKISMSYGVLSLSRAALNPLMWAHYARGKKQPSKKGIRIDQNNEAHGGMVIGFDTIDAELDCELSNLIPAKFGSIIYTSTKPTEPFHHSEHDGLFEGMSYRYELDLQETLQRVFLYKSQHWAYEEEVRVVRNILKGDEVQRVNRSSIKEIYIGAGHFYDKEYLSQLQSIIESNLPDCKIFVCHMKEKSWGIKAVNIERAVECSGM